MSDRLLTAANTTIKTLLLVGDSVAEVSADMTVSQIWLKGNVQLSAFDRNAIGKRLPEISKEHILAWATEQVAAAFATGGNSYREVLLPTINGVMKYSIRVLNNHPEKDCLYVVIEHLHVKAGEEFDGVKLRQSLEEVLNANEHFYENVLGDIAGDVVVFDDQLRFLYINRVAVKNDEVRQWLIGKTDEDFCRLRNRPLAIAESRRAYYLQAIEERRIVEFEEQSANAAGDIFYHVRRVKPIFYENGELNVLVGYGLNITDRIIAEKTLKASEDTFASAFGYSGIGMSLVGMNGKWIDVNGAFCQMTGYSREELLQFTFQSITYPDDVNLLPNLVRKLLRKEILSETIEQRYVAKGNKIVWVLLTISLVWNHDGTPKFYIAQVVDITQKKELENEIKRKNAELEASRQSLINKVDQLEELSYIIAHNLRGPAGNISTLAETLKDIYDAKGSEADALNDIPISAEECIRFIAESSGSLLSSLDTLMEITAIKLNKEVPHDHCDVNSVLQDITTQLQSQIFEKRASIRLHSEIDSVHYPKAYLENIMYNLVSNALKYSKAETTPEIDIHFSIVDDRVRLRIKDNGLGIDMRRYGTKIFKLNQVFHKGFNSKGIGLFITKTQVESLGGTINLVSNVNEGSEFIVTF